MRHSCRPGTKVQISCRFHVPVAHRDTSGGGEESKCDFSGSSLGVATSGTKHFEVGVGPGSDPRAFFALLITLMRTVDVMALWFEEVLTVGEVPSSSCRLRLLLGIVSAFGLASARRVRDQVSGKLLPAQRAMW